MPAISSKTTFCKQNKRNDALLYLEITAQLQYMQIYKENATITYASRQQLSSVVVQQSLTASAGLSLVLSVSLNILSTNIKDTTC